MFCCSYILLQQTHTLSPADGNSYEDDTSFAQPPVYHHYDVVQPHPTTAPPPTQLPATNQLNGRRDSENSDETIHSTKEETPVILLEDEV